MTKPPTDLAPYQHESLSDNVGTSTSADEAPLRAIGEQAFSIRYPRNITPDKRLSTRTDR